MRFYYVVFLCLFVAQSLLSLPEAIETIAEKYDQPELNPALYSTLGTTPSQDKLISILEHTPHIIESFIDQKNIQEGLNLISESFIIDCDAFNSAQKKINSSDQEYKKIIQIKDNFQKIINVLPSLLEQFDRSKAEHFIKKVKERGFNIQGSNGGSELLKVILGTGTLTGAAFLIAYYLGYKPPALIGQNVESLPGWDKVQKVIRLLISQWKTIGLSLVGIKIIRILNSYYYNRVVPWLKKKSRRSYSTRAR